MRSVPDGRLIRHPWNQTKGIEAMQGLKMLRTAAGTSVIAAACLAPSAHAAAGAGNAVCSTANGTTSCTYPYIGDTQLFQVPRNVTSLHIVAYGAAGGWIEGNATGLVTESKVTADIPVVYRQALEVVVGGQGGTGSRTLAQNNQFYGNLQQGGAGGYNGGGPGGFGVGNGTAGPSGPNGPNRGGGGGGGATDIRMGDNTCVAMGNCPLSRRVLVAGGAGGLSGNYDTKSHAGGLPGYTAGKHGASIYSDGSGAGQGGTQAAGGAGGPVLATGCKSGTAPAGDGALGVGGAGGQGGNTASQSTATGQVGNTGYGGSGGGGGGGGYYGGGGGGGGDCSQGWGSGGGGGSNFGPAGTTYDLATTMNWNGSVVISYTPQPTAASSNPTAKHHHKKKRHHKKKHHQKSHY